MAKKKKDPLGAAAQQVVKKTTDKVVKQTTQKRTAEQKVRSAAKGVAGNIVKNKAPGTVKKNTANKSFKASNISGNTGRSIKKQDRERTAKKYATMNQAKRTAKSNVTATQKGEKVMGGNAVQRNVLQKNKPTRLSRMDDFMLTDRGKNEVNNAKALYEVARRNNDEAGMKLAHGMAELARLNNQTRRRNDSGDIVGPYSGGTWGDRYIEANMGNFNTGQTGLREPEKNFLRSEAYQVRSALNEAGAGYINTLREFPLRLPEGQGSSQLMIKGSDQDKYSSNVVDRRGQSRYTEEDMANKALEFQAASDAQRELGYQTTPINGFAGQFIGDATRVATGIGLDAAANAVVPGAGLVNMGARTWGTQVKQAKDEQKLRGTDKEPFADLKAYMYGTAMTGVEVATEKMFDGVKLFGKSVYGAGGATTKLGKMMDDVFNVGINRAVARLAKTPGGEAAISALMNIGKSGLEEGLEELVADFVQWQMPKIYGGDVEGAKEMLTGALYDFALGAAMGGFGGVTSTGSSMREAYLDRANRNAETISNRMSDLGADKEQAKTALSRMTINQLESLAEASDDVLRNTGMAMGLISPENANQSLTEASKEQRSEQTVEDGQPAVSRSKAKDALRKRLRSMDIRDADRLRGIMDGLSAQEMDTASKMSAEDLSAWVDGRESGEIAPAEQATVVEDVEEEEDEFAATPAQIRSLGNKLSELGVDSHIIARALGNNAVLDELVNMDMDELSAWAEEQAQPTPAQPEALAEQTELLEAQRQERQEEAQAPATPLERSASVLGAAGRTAFISSYNPSKRSDLYTAEAYRAYNAGFTGNARPTLYKTLNRASSEALYQAGVIDRQSSMRARENKKRNAIVFDKNTSELYWDENVERTIAAYSQAEGVRRFTQKDAQHLDRIVRALGKKAFFVESIDSLTEPRKHDIANGSYADGILKISLKTVDPISFTFGHEITHAMAEMSPKEYKRLERYVMGLEQSESQLAAIRKAYEDLKLPLSQETAIEEVVADYVGQMVTDLDLLERFARQVDRNVLQKFFDALRSLARKLTGKDKEDVNKAVKLVENMLSASVKQNKRMAKLNVSSEDILEGKAIVNSDTGEQYSIRASTFDINEGVMFEDLVNAEIMTQKEADELRENMSNLVREMIPYAHILDQNEEWSREDRPYSPLKPNSDPLYKISLDFTTLCRKRLLTQAIIERIQMEEKKAVSSDRQLKIRSLLQEYREIDNAVQVACGMCYVEAARLKSPKVINEFLKNPAPTVRNYFAKKDSGFEAWVKEQGANFKEEHGYSRTATKSEMSNTDREALNKMNSQLRKNYKLSTAQQEIMDKIKAMPPETFLSEANLTRLLVEEPVIYDIFISKVRAATRSKALQGPVPYYYGDSKGAISDRAIERMNAENGLRFQSWSDWQVQHLLDMMTAVIDLSVRGVKMHGYTKFPEEVRIFGNTGMQFNLSGVLGTVDPIINEDGTYSKDNFDSVEGVDIKEAKKVRDEFPDTAGIQCIGVSDAQILSLLNTDWVDYVIPYHSSGLNKALRKIAGIEKWEDYTKVQEAHPIDKKAEPGPGQDAENWHKEPAFSEFMVWDGENGLDCMRKSADRYVQLCEERGMVPKFNDLRTSGKPGAENYWKLLIDRKMINQKTGELIIQQAVRPSFNFKAMRDAIKREVDSYDPSRENRVFKYVVENGSKKGIRFSKEMKEKAASLGNTVIENVVSDSAETTPKYSARGTGYQFNDTVVLEESTVDTYLRDYAAPSSPNYAQAYIVHMSPRQFLDLTTSRTGRASIERDATDLDLEQLADATRFQPFQLRIDHETGEVTGHEGRHRMESLRRNNVYNVPVLLFDSSNKNSKEAMDSLTLLGQDFGSTRSLAMTTVHDVLPLNYANRDEIIRRFATQPTDERIAENYGRQTVRYSARGTGYQPSTQRDADYMDAVQDGDMDTAQRLVDEAAKDAGYTIKAYHGTANGGKFTIFDPKKLNNSKMSSHIGQGFYFTNSREGAKEYTKNMDAYGKVTKGSNPNLFEGYIRLQNPIKITNNSHVLTLKQIRNIVSDGNKKWFFESGIAHVLQNKDIGGGSYTKDDIKAMDIEKRIDLYSRYLYRFGDMAALSNMVDAYTFDSQDALLLSIQYHTGYDGIHWEQKEGLDQFVVFDSSQFKDSSPVTYDDNGNIIPLSERFDPDKPDIRWSIRGGLTYDQMVERYGSIKPGERRSRNVAVPKQTSDNTKVHQTIRTIMEAGRTPEDILPRLKEMIESGEFSYEVFGNREGVEYAQGVVADKGFAEAYKDWSAEIEKKIVSPQNVAMGWVLYDTAVENKDWDMVARISMQMAKYANTIGQGLQAMRILKMFSPEMQLAVMDGPKPERVRKKLEKRKQQEEQPADTYDEEEEEDDDIDLPGAFFGEEDEERPAPQKKPRKKPQRRTPREEQSDTNEDESDTEITQRDVEETAEYQAKHSKSTLIDMWNSWRYLAMLFNARTHIRNIVGNLGFAPIVMSKNLTATAAEIAIYHTVGKHFGMKRTKGVYNPRMFAYGWKDFEQMRPTIMGEAKYEGQEPKQDEVVFRGILAPLEKARKLNSAALDLEDAWFSRPQYANALAQYMAANGITVEMMETGAGEITRGPHKGEHITAKIMDEARAYAVKEAQKATYRDLNDLSQFFMRVGKPKTDDPTKVEKVVHVLIEGVIPFRKTPANILVRAMEYSPVGFAHGMKKLLYDVPATYHVRNRLEKLQQKIDAGEELTDKEKKFREKASKFEPTTVAEALDRLCSGMSGTAIFALGMTLAKLGILVAKTDNGDDDQKYFSKLLGHQQWALEVGGYSFTIDWLAPEVVPLFMGAQYFTGFNEGDPIRNFSSLADSLSMVIDPVLELSCMSGIQEALNNAAAFSEGDVNTMVGLASSLGLSYLSQGIPTLFGQLERASQAERMTTFTQDEQLIPADWQYQIGKLSAKIPGWDYHQIPYVDSWGNTETETVLWKRIVANMFNPAYVKKIDTRDVNKELQRLYDATGDGDVLPKPGWKTYRYTDENGKNQTVYLTEEEYLAYGRAKGRNQFDLVSKFLKSNAYKNMTDPDRANVLDDIYYYSEYKAQKEYINNYKGEPYSWVSNYEAFSNAVGGYDVADFIIVRGATRDVKGLYDPKKPGSNAISGTSACNKLLAIYNSGVHIPSDPAQREAFMEALEVAKTYRGYNKAQAEDHLNKTRKKYGITE